ncbi:MAG: FesM [Anaerolineae bacterium]|nr:FesM [Anaerolineae bacterium]
MLHLPLVGRLLRWRWGRLALQLPFFIVAALLLIDGFTGPQNAARNLATVAPWVQYRGLLILAVLLAGNLFCMACPFTLPRTLAKRFSLGERRFPKLLRNKWLAIGGLFVIFLLYEWLDLWASPWLTAWLIVAYFVAAFALEAFFKESPFCKYVCPLGSFNFVYGTLSPSQIAVKNADICGQCAGKECINGSYSPQTVIRLDTITLRDAAGTEQRYEQQVIHGPQGTPGCGTELFAPQIKSNLDCIYCLDCARACPHQNIGLFVRTPGRELLQPEAWPKRWDVSLLVICLAFMSVTNAFGMVPPVYALEQSLIDVFGFQSELPVLLLIFGVGNLLLPMGLALLAGTLSRTFTRSALSLRDTVAAFAPAFVPVGFSIWFAHYGFHFLIAPLSIIPVFQEFMGQPGDWALFSVALEGSLIGLIQVVALLGGLLWSLVIAQRAALRLYRRDGLIGLLPWAVLLLLLMLAALQIFSLPMEMRGTEAMFR